jgi:hypothetical protein
LIVERPRNIPENQLELLAVSKKQEARVRNYCTNSVRIHQGLDTNANANHQSILAKDEQPDNLSIKGTRKNLVFLSDKSTYQEIPDSRNLTFSGNVGEICKIPSPQGVRNNIVLAPVKTKDTEK